MPYWTEPKYNDPDEIDTPSDVRLPDRLHHTQARAELECLVDAGAIGDREADRLLERWGSDDGDDVIDDAIGAEALVRVEELTRESDGLYVTLRINAPALPVSASLGAFEATFDPRGDL